MSGSGISWAYAMLTPFDLLQGLPPPAGDTCHLRRYMSFYAHAAPLAIEVSLLPVLIRRKPCHHIFDRTWTTDTSSMHWEDICLGYSQPRPIVTNFLLCTSEAHWLTDWQGSHWSWKVLKSPEIWLFVFQDLKSPEIGHGCWKSHEKVLIFASVIMKNQDTESVIFSSNICA